MVLCGWMCDNSHMATNLAISPDLLERAVELSGDKTKNAQRAAASWQLPRP